MSDYQIGIIGGGINGVGLARELAYRGISVVLFEKGDIGQGTSSASTKLAHGGLRYLEQGHFRLVKEALKERFLLIQNAPCLVKPLEFIIPIYHHSPVPIWKLGLGVWIYHLLAGKKDLGKPRYHGPQSLLAAYPSLNPEGLIGGISYWDAQMDDARLCLETALQAQEFGAKIHTYTEVKKISEEKPHQARIDTDTHSVLVDCVINASGPWVNQVLENCCHFPVQPIRPSKGSHIIINPLLIETACLIFSPIDGRVMFAIPYEGHTLIGTTEHEQFGSPDDVHINSDEVDYLLSSAQIYFSTELSKADIISTFSGVRPLVDSIGQSAGKLSREHKLIEHSDRIFSLIGGKYTTYRAICEDVAHEILDKLVIPFDRTKSTETLVFNQHNDDTIISDNPSLSKYLQGTECPQAEVIYSIRHEWAKHIDDFLRRRSKLSLLPGNGRQCMDEVLALFASELNWDLDTMEKEKNRYLLQIEKMLAL